ncbi:MAG: FAD-dependent oxidoreductase, partial [Verrucomicrobiota bacterium]
MGQDAVDQAIQVGALENRPPCTAEMRLHGWTDKPGAGFQQVYGSDLEEIRALPGAEKRVHP